MSNSTRSFFKLACFLAMLWVPVPAACPQQPAAPLDPLDGLSETLKTSLRNLAGKGGDLLLYRRLWELQRVPRVSNDEAKKLQAAFLSVPDWQDKLWKRIAEAAEQGEFANKQLKALRDNEAKIFADMQVDRSDMVRWEAGLKKIGAGQAELQRIVDSRGVLNRLVSPLGYLDSAEAAHLVFPLFESKSDMIVIGDVGWSTHYDAAFSVLNTLHLRGVVFSDDPYPFRRGSALDESREWIIRQKSIYGTKYRLPYLQNSNTEMKSPKASSTLPPKESASKSENANTGVKPAINPAIVTQPSGGNKYHIFWVSAGLMLLLVIAAVAVLRRAT
jgi:hypothetical protein